jgi:hypothetical protein
MERCGMIVRCIIQEDKIVRVGTYRSKLKLKVTVYSHLVECSPPPPLPPPV